MPVLPFTLSEEQKNKLLHLAAYSINYSLEHNERWKPDSLPEEPLLTNKGCCFVSLHKNQQLRGCIGSLSAYQPLWQDVVTHAYDAAFRDPRFSPLTKDELNKLDIEVSILTPSKQLECNDYHSLCHILRPLIDGVILEENGRTAVFLPQVWQQLPSKEEFLSALLQKGGWPNKEWPKDIKVSTFEVLHCQSDFLAAMKKTA